MKPEDEKVFDEQLDKMLAGCPKEVRDIYEAKRAELKKLTNEVRLGMKATDDMLRHRLGPLYPFIVPQGSEIEIPIIRKHIQLNIDDTRKLWQSGEGMMRNPIKKHEV
jgi:hypothetical protein